MQKLLAESLRWLFLDKSIFKQTNDSPAITNVYQQDRKYVHVSAHGQAIITLCVSIKNVTFCKSSYWILVLYGCETWSLTLRKERRPKVFENRVLGRIFEPRRDEVTGEWRKLHNEELNDLYCSPNTVRVIKSRAIWWAGHVACMGERRGVYRVMVGRPKGKIPLGRPY